MFLKRMTLFFLALLSLGIPNSFAKTLRLVSLEQPPLVYVEKGEIKGLTKEIVEEAFKRINQPVTFKVFPLSRSLKMMKTGDADAIFSIVKSSERQAFMDYSDEVLIEQQAVLFVSKNSSIVFNGDLKSLSAYRFGIMHGATYGSQWYDAKKMGYINKVEEVASYQQNLQKLLNGRVDIIIGPHYTMLDLIAKKQLSGKVKQLFPVIESVPTYLAFAKNRVPDDIRQQFDQALKDMKSEGIIEKLILSYIGS